MTISIPREYTTLAFFPPSMKLMNVDKFELGQFHFTYMVERLQRHADLALCVNAILFISRKLMHDFII